MNKNQSGLNLEFNLYMMLSVLAFVAIILRESLPGSYIQIDPNLTPTTHLIICTQIFLTIVLACHISIKIVNRKRYSY